MTRSAAEIVSLLVVSRDFGVLRSISSMGVSNSWQFETASNAWEAMERVQSGTAPNLLLLDLPQGDADGLDILRWLRRIRPAMPVILIGHPGDMCKQEESARIGASGYLTRPIDERQLATVIEANLSTEVAAPVTDITSEDVEKVGDDAYFVATSPLMRKIRSQAVLLAESNAPVLILGEDGSGKETIARLIHKLSVRSGFNFAKVSCAALPEDLLEKELFGYQTAGITSRSKTRPGKLDLCAKGTILLEAINEMPAALQSSILSVIKTKGFIRPGTSTFAEADVRILASSPANGERPISDRGLKGDLYHHISAYTIHVPPLRDRKEGIPLLARHFMHRLSRHYGLPPRDLSPAILEAWEAYDWPGNLSEMEHLVKRYLMVGDQELAIRTSRPALEGTGRKTAPAMLRRIDDPVSSALQPAATDSGSKSLRSLLKSVKSEAEKNAIAMALEKTGGNRKAAARLLNVSYRTVLYKIEEYNMTPHTMTQPHGVADSTNGEKRDRGEHRAGLGKR